MSSLAGTAELASAPAAHLEASDPSSEHSCSGFEPYRPPAGSAKARTVIQDRALDDCRDPEVAARLLLYAAREVRRLVRYPGASG